MKILWLFLLFAFESLFVNYASSQCQSLNGTLFNSCFNAGYNVSEFNNGKAQQGIFSLFERVQRKFNNCSSLSTVLSCALHVPKCPNSTLPCKAECRKFVRDCKDIPAESQGLRALFQGLCELLEPKPCLSMSNASSFNGSDDDVTCSPLRISHCANAGYSFTRVSRAYQDMVESSKIFQGVNSTLKKVICMELAPPCETNKSRTVYVPCRSTCEAANNESNSKFLDFFKSSDYCSTFPYEEHKSGKAYCALRTWPNTGYWPSHLWERISSTGTKLDAIASNSIWFLSNDSSISPGSNLTTSQPTASTRGTSTTRASTANSPLKSSGTSTFPAPSTNSSGTSTVPAPSTNSSGTSTVPAPSTNSSGTSTVPAPSTNSSGPSTTRAPSTNSSGPSTTPAPSTNSSGPSTTPAPSTNSSGPSTTPAPSTNSSAPSTTPAPSTNSSGPSTTPAPSTNSSGTSTIPAPSTKPSGPSTTPASSTEPSGTSTTPATSTEPSGTSTTPASPSNSSAVNTTSVTTTNSSGTSGKLVRTTQSAGVRTSGTAVSETRPAIATTENKGAPGIKATLKKKLSPGAISGIVVGLLIVLAAIVVGGVCFRRYNKRRAQYRHSLMVDMDEL